MSRSDLRRAAVWLFLVGATMGASELRGDEPSQAPGKDPLLSIPGSKSFSGDLPPLTQAQKALADALRKDVEAIAAAEHNMHRYPALVETARRLEDSLSAMGYKVERQKYSVQGRDCWNLVVEVPGGAKKGEIVIAGAHYDSVRGAPGANDNGSGVAGVLAIARAVKDFKPVRTLRLVLFTNEEPPYFQTEQMGSYVYAKGCAERKENIVAMLSLETLGYYSDEKGSQKYPALLAPHFPAQGNFVAFVGNVKSGPLVVSAVKTFRSQARFPSEGAALPEVFQGVGWSDHWSFWQFGYPAIMVTDTAPFRYPHYHLASDMPDKLEYERMARVVEGLIETVKEMAR